MRSFGKRARGQRSVSICIYYILLCMLLLAFVFLSLSLTLSFFLTLTHDKMLLSKHIASLRKSWKIPFQQIAHLMLIKTNRLISLTFFPLSNCNSIEIFRNRIELHFWQCTDCHENSIENKHHKIT